MPRVPDSRGVTVCATDCDFVTIQAAIDDPSTLPGDFIYVADAIHTEAGITVNKDVTIRGRGAQHTIVEAHPTIDAAADRVFFITKGTTVTIEAMTIRHGRPVEGLRSGGGIQNQGTLRLAHCVVSHNRANCGGGILNDGGTLAVVNCTIRDNTADGMHPNPGYACGSGGAIKNVEGGILEVMASTFSHNHAAGKGGGLHVSCKSSATLTNCTISGNDAMFRGGGIHSKGMLTLVHCTISGNSARGISRGQATGDTVAGGLAVRGKGVLYITHTLIANNPQDGDCLIDSSVTIAANAYNLVEDGSCPSDYKGDPNLGPLTDNGGDAQTCALLPGSLAVDAIPGYECPVDVDQRGYPRPVSQESLGALGDIGAFELQ
jgi:hypothetical protein